MFANVRNTIKQIYDAEKMVKYCYELNLSGLLKDIFTSEYFKKEKNRIETFGIGMDFNFELWGKLLGCQTLFNYLKVSQKQELKEKWVYAILEKIPEVESVLSETHTAFQKYKDILYTVLNR